MMWWWLAVSGAAVCAGRAAARWLRAEWLLARIPPCCGPRPPLLGNLLDLLLTPEELFTFLRDVYARTRGINVVRGLLARYVNIYDPEDIEKILSSPRYNLKGDPYTFLHPWLGEGLLVSNGEKWQKRRKLLTGAFHFSILRQFTRVFWEQAETLVRELDAAAAHAAHEDGFYEVELDAPVARATLRVMCETSMGTAMHEGIESVSERYLRGIQALGELVVQRVSRVFLHPAAAWLLAPARRRQRALLADLHAFTDALVLQRRRHLHATAPTTPATAPPAPTRPAMLDLLLREADAGQLDARGVREEVDTFLFEGHDTTASALRNVLALLAERPDLQEGIYEESCLVLGAVEAVVETLEGEGAVEVPPERLAELRLLERCVKEALRLAPSVPLLARTLPEDTTLSGFVVPAGTVVNVHVYDVHRRADLWPAPERFDPDRFLPERAAARHPYAYIPFSAGPRNCIGQKFAMLELKAMTVRVVRRFYLAPPAPCAAARPPRRRRADLVLRDAAPTRLRLRPRR